MLDFDATGDMEHPLYATYVQLVAAQADYQAAIRAGNWIAAGAARRQRDWHASWLGLTSTFHLMIQ